jgi:hypothetical protein
MPKKYTWQGIFLLVLWTLLIFNNAEKFFVTSRQKSRTYILLIFIMSICYQMTNFDVFKDFIRRSSNMYITYLILFPKYKFKNPINILIYHVMLIVSGTVPAVMHNSYIGEGGGGALYKY